MLICGKGPRNEEFKPQNEFKLDPWINLRGRSTFNKAVLYVIVAAALTCFTMIYIARRMQQRPNRVQTAVEALYGADARQHHARQHGRPRWRRSGSRSSATLFLFIWFSNMIGYLPLPTNTEHKVDIFGARGPVVRALRGDREHLGPARARR